MGESFYPLKFHEIYKERPWASDGLRRICLKNLPAGARVGESWEVADLPPDVSIVKEGAWAGLSLSELIQRYPERMLGRRDHSEQLPLLFKLIATGEALSVQVHPDDQYAARRHPGARGKIEAWYILHADPGAWIVLGLNRMTNRVEMEEFLIANQIEVILHKFPVHAGETYLVRPGMIHCIGPGVVLAEIQQSSDLTYRLYDWGRMGLDGKPRQLHVQDALNVVRCREAKPSRCEPKDISVNASLRWYKLVECEAFVFERLVVEKEEAFLPPRESFQILYVIEGEGILKQPSSIFRKRPAVSVRKGESVLLPVMPDGLYIAPQGQMDLLLVDASPTLSQSR